MKRYAFTLFLLAGLVCAQPPQGPRPHMRPPQGNPDDMLEQRLTKNLGLNAIQQNNVHTLLAENRVMSKGMGQQMQTLHGQLVTAVKNGDESTIESVSVQISNLRQQQETQHAKAMAKIYATLTPDQKTKVGPNLEMLMGRGGMGFGPGRRPGPPPNGAPQVKQ